MGRWHNLALFVMALLAAPLTAAQDGTATPQPPRLVATVVPANGVVGVWVQTPEIGDSLVHGDELIVVAAADGSVVAGSVSARKLSNFAVFRPSQPLVEGAAYTLTFRRPDHQADLVAEKLWKALEFSAAAPRDPDDAPPLASIDEGFVESGTTARECCETTCFSTSTFEGVHAVLSARFDAAPSVIGQYVYAFAWENMPASSWSTTPLISVLPPTRNERYEPCRVLWAHSLSDDTEQTIGRACVDERLLVPEHYVSFVPMLDDTLAFDNCMLPPATLLAHWCSLNREQCADDPAGCPGYARKCPDYAVKRSTGSTMTDFPAAPAGCAVSAIGPRRMPPFAVLAVFATRRATRTARRRS